MPTIGGKTKIVKADKPQFVVKLAEHLNEYLKLTWDGTEVSLSWIGDPNAATKFDNKYAAKYRIREFDDIPATRCIRKV